MIISHSEVEAFLLCERRHYYAHGEKLQKREFSENLRRGISGHAMLHHFFMCLHNGGTWREAEMMLDEYVGDHMNMLDDVNEKTLTIKWLTLVKEALKYWRPTVQQWQIEGVEKEYRVELERYTYAFTVDLLIWNGTGYEVIDWKFVQDFYDLTAIKLLPQIPKYIGGLRMLGYPIRSGQYGFLRYRSLKNNHPKNLFKLEPVTPPDIKIYKTFKEFERVADQIFELKSKDPIEWEQRVARVGNNLICRSCSYKSICALEFEGHDATRTKKELYVPNTYGYNELETVEEGGQ